MRNLCLECKPENRIKGTRDEKKNRIMEKEQLLPLGGARRLILLLDAENGSLFFRKTPYDDKNYMTIDDDTRSKPKGPTNGTDDPTLTNETVIRVDRAASDAVTSLIVAHL